MPAGQIHCWTLLAENLRPSVSVGKSSHDSVDKRFTANEPGEVIQEMLDDRFGLVGLAAGDVGRDEAGRCGEQRVAVGQGLGVGDIQPGGGSRWERSASSKAS